MDSILQVLMGLIYIFSGAWFSDNTVVNNVHNGTLYTENKVPIMKMVIVEDEGIVGDWYLVSANDVEKIFTVERDIKSNTLKFSFEGMEHATDLHTEIAYGMNMKIFDENINHHIVSVVFGNQRLDGSYEATIFIAGMHPLQVLLTRDKFFFVPLQTS